jgi:hypothetical protein
MSLASSAQHRFYGGYRRQRGWAIGLYCALSIALTCAPTKAQDDDPVLLPAPSTSLYASLGIGFINIDEQGPGVRAPLGLVAAFNAQRLILRTNLLDLSFLEGDDRDARYARSYSAYAPSNCYDTQTGYYVSSYRCSGGTDLLASASAELTYVALRDVWLSNNRGNVFVGAGWRLKSPRSAYGSIGFFFERPRHSSGGVQLMIGQGFVGFGLLWGYDLRRLF